MILKKNHLLRRDKGNEIKINLRTNIFYGYYK